MPRGTRGGARFTLTCTAATRNMVSISSHIITERRAAGGETGDVVRGSKRVYARHHLLMLRAPGPVVRYAPGRLLINSNTAAKGTSVLHPASLPFWALGNTMGTLVCTWKHSHA